MTSSPGWTSACTRAEERLRPPGGDRDLRLRRHASPVQRHHLVRNRFAQRRQPGHGGVLVQSGTHVAGDELDQAWRRREIRKALRQIDGVVLRRQARHHRKDGRADIGQLAIRAVTYACAPMSHAAASALAARPQPSPRRSGRHRSRSGRHDLRAAAQQRPEMIPVLGDAAADDEQVGPEEPMHLRRGPALTSAAHSCQSGRDRRARAPRHAVRPPRPDLQVAELGVGHQPSVDEQRRADAGAQRQRPARFRHARDPRPCRHLGKTRGIGVVQERPPAGACAREQAPGRPCRSSARSMFAAVIATPCRATAGNASPTDPWTACGSAMSASRSSTAAGGAPAGVGTTVDEPLEERAAHRVDARRLYERAPDVKGQDLRFGGVTANSAHDFGRALSPASGSR